MYKVVLLGEGRVGKSSMIKQIIKGTFEDDEKTTTQASHYTKGLVVNGINISLEIWDTAGQEQYHALGPVYYRDADAAILVFDVTLPETFEMVKSWVKEMNMACQKKVVYVVAGNKVDLLPNGDYSEARAFANSIQGSYIETSAKTGANVNELLVLIAKKLIEQRNEIMNSSSYSISAPMLVPEEPEKKKCCC